MNPDCEPVVDQLCGCCTGTGSETPELITNRAALPQVAYRVGRYATFAASMLAALSDPERPALALLRTRERSDFSIGLLDAWAVALDILTFYQERFANDAFLRTAVDQRSVFELAALVGYAPSPGVAASAVLAFTLSSAPGSPESVVIPAGSRVQSVPGPGQTPQVFETSSELTARIAWNALPAQTTVSWKLSASDTSTWIAGTNNNINVGDGLLFVSAENGVPSSAGPCDFQYVSAVRPDPQSGNTEIAWDGPLASPLADALGSGADTNGVCLYVFRKKAGLYGAQAPNPQTLSTTNTNITSVPGWPGGQGAAPSGPTWDYTQLYQDYSNQIYLDGVYPGLAPPPDGQPRWLVLTGTSQGYTSVFQIAAALDTNPGYFTLTTKSTQLTLNEVEILVGDTGLTANELIYLFVKETPGITAYLNGEQLTPAELPLTDWDEDYVRPTDMVAPVAGSSISVRGVQQIGAAQPIGVSGKRLRLQLPLEQSATFVPAGQSQGWEAPGGQVFVIDRFPPQEDPVNVGSVLWAVETLSGVKGTISVADDPGAVELLPCDPKADATVGEATTVQSAVPDSEVTTLTLQGPLARIYDATTVAVNANAVPATHGETVHEILGSGDAAADPLQFTLKQAPLTYLSAASTSGVSSTLQVWVNNLRWSESANLLSCGPADRAFVTSVNPAGNRVVTFGDGTQGGRPPTGVSNIRAVYRKGLGSAGMVSAGQLSQPLDRPLGVASVTNPGPASGGADPATAAEARGSAPLPTLTIGRVVSLEDYQNFAMSFPGIAKALAAWAWFGAVRGVFLTIAGVNGATLSADDPIVGSLIGAIELIDEPFVPLRVASYVPTLFTFTASVAVQQDHAPDEVLAQVWQALVGAFAFDRRGFGQSVGASEIVAVMQQVGGVTAVQLQALGLSGEAASSPAPAILCATGPQPPQGAQLLMLDPATSGSIGLWS